jgi:hypothetical protein
MIIMSTTATSQTRRRTAPRRSQSAAKAAAEKTAAEVKAGRERVAAQIKTLTHFLYLYGGITKGIESTEQATRESAASAVVLEQNERNKVKVRDGIRNVRAGLDKLEADFRFSPALRNYYTQLAGVASSAQAAENQAAANRFDEAGRSLLRVVSQLADTLALMR